MFHFESQTCLNPLTVAMVTLTPLELQSRFGDKLLKFQVVCPQNGTAVQKGLNG